MKEIQIVYAEEKYFSSFHAALDEVANERINIDLLTAPSLQDVETFQKRLIIKNCPVFYAIDREKVVGWCDVSRSDQSRFAHRGHLGLGVLREYRNQKLGRKLMSKALDHAKSIGIEKLELSVFASNVNAIRLYEKMGFQYEGLIKNHRKLDGIVFDTYLMALVLS
ncbi:MAG: GNAT family N-acetyltransferase [Proteobacteria bacterium]|nr:GNAT family N-acetyltransferase [Pseudomonadota bacterium]